jgi:cyclophilin family peptidyl-prolyl cis-trans isomerase
MWLGCASPKAGFIIPSESKVAPSKISFVNTSTTSTQYEWDFGDGHTATQAFPTHTYTQSGLYEVKLTSIKNNKKNQTSQKVYIASPQVCTVSIETTEGTIVMQLYDDTPLHRDNFIKLVEEGYYDDLLFHRVIKGFMIQGGDPDSRGAEEGRRLGMGGPRYMIPAEIRDTLYHIRGAVAAARTGDQVNPKKESSGSQFFIVHGRPSQPTQLTDFALSKGISYPSHIRSIYELQGGAPQLDGEYTIYGQVISGMDVIDRIVESKIDGADRPLTDVKILAARVVK